MEISLPNPFRPLAGICPMLQLYATRNSNTRSRMMNIGPSQLAYSFWMMELLGKPSQNDKHQCNGTTVHGIGSQEDLQIGHERLLRGGNHFGSH
ncbi:hypothetical protein D9M72_636700 [compost metagenome]